MEFTTRHYIKPERWNADTQRMSGTNDEAIQQLLQDFKETGFKTQRLMIEGNRDVTAEALKDRLLGKLTTNV
jgi:hypothetical protein